MLRDALTETDESEESADMGMAGGPDSEWAGIVGRRILQERRLRKWSQRQIGRLAGLRHDRVSKIELGRSQIFLHEAIRLARAFGLSLDDLVFGQGDRSDDQGGPELGTQARIAELERYHLLLLRLLLIYVGAPPIERAPEDQIS